MRKTHSLKIASPKLMLSLSLGPSVRMEDLLDAVTIVQNRAKSTHLSEHIRSKRLKKKLSY